MFGLSWVLWGSSFTWCISPWSSPSFFLLRRTFFSRMHQLRRLLSNYIYRTFQGTAESRTGQLFEVDRSQIQQRNYNALNFIRRPVMHYFFSWFSTGGKFLFLYIFRLSRSLQQMNENGYTWEREGGSSFLAERKRAIRAELMWFGSGRR